MFQLKTKHVTNRKIENMEANNFGATAGAGATTGGQLLVYVAAGLNLVMTILIIAALIKYLKK